MTFPVQFQGRNAAGTRPANRVSRIISLASGTGCATIAAGAPKPFQPLKEGSSMLYVIYMCSVLTQGCHYDKDRDPHFNALAPCQAQEKVMNKGLDGKTVLFRCAKYTKDTVPM
jgi:hypothetical protein